jgi:hypothetical protein
MHELDHARRGLEVRLRDNEAAAQKEEHEWIAGT